MHTHITSVGSCSPYERYSAAQHTRLPAWFLCCPPPFHVYLLCFFSVKLHGTADEEGDDTFPVSEEWRWACLFSSVWGELMRATGTSDDTKVCIWNVVSSCGTVMCVLCGVTGLAGDTIKY